MSRKKPLLWLSAIGGVLLVSVVLVNGPRWYRIYTGTYHPAPRDDGLRERRARLEAIFQDAKNRIRESQWTEAKARLLDLQTLEPDFPSLRDYLEKVELELPNQEHLTTARAALAQKKLGVAKAELDQVRSETMMYDQLAQLRMELQDTADARVREAKMLHDLDKRDQVIEIVTDVLAAFPQHHDAQRLLEDSQPPPIVDPGPLPVAPGVRQWGQAVDLFMAGDLSGAMKLAQSCASTLPECQSGLADMKEFGKLYKKLETLDAKGLARLLALDQRLTQGRGTHGHGFASRVATVFYKKASAARVQGEWARAVEWARSTLHAEPGHVGATALLNELKSKAKDVYLYAYALKEAEPKEALLKFREVLVMTPQDDEVHQKAQSWLEKLSKQ